MSKAKSGKQIWKQEEMFFQRSFEQVNFIDEERTLALEAEKLEIERAQQESLFGFEKMSAFEMDRSLF